VKVIVEAGAFVAVERRDRRIEAMLRVLHEQSAVRAISRVGPLRTRKWLGLPAA